MNEVQHRVYTFGGFRLDAANRLLFAGEQLITLTPKAFDTLLVLVESGGSVLSKEDLMRRVWAEQIVEENNLAQHIHVLRKSLGEAGAGGKYIETIPKRGYRFVARVEVLEESAGTHDDSIAGVTDSLPVRSLPAVLKPKTQYATSPDGVNIAYQVVGEGPLDLVFVMGWVSHLEFFWREPSFARFLQRLASFSRLILFDKRGTGLSDPVAVSDLPTLEQRMTDVQAVMDAVGSERAALLGVSDGGPMCALFAATYPERTVALAMIGTYAKRVRSADYPWAPSEPEYAAFLEEIRTAWGGPVGLLTRAPSVAGDPQFRDWWAGCVIWRWRPLDGRREQAAFAIILERNLWPRLQRAHDAGTQAAIRQQFFRHEGGQNRIAQAGISGSHFLDSQIVRQMAWADDLDAVGKDEDANRRADEIVPVYQRIHQQFLEDDPRHLRLAD
jgi:DNA-binding winged helix-turn-helix (wHTH) protein/pimeloyl-ACP methyl ester carboxylesterase